MYFSLITPTPGAEREAAIQWSKGPYEQHQWLWQFLHAERGTARDFLFRRRDGEGNSLGFYVVSAREPQAISSAWLVQSKAYAPRLHTGQHLAFQLRANPVVSHQVAGKSRRDDVVMNRKKQMLAEKGLVAWKDWPDTDPEKPLQQQLIQEACTEWLLRRAERCGFRLVNDEYDQLKLRVDGYQQQRAFKRDIRFSSVDYSGVLEVVDVELINKTLLGGIGHAKAFGCGLMLIRSV